MNDPNRPHGSSLDFWCWSIGSIVAASIVGLAVWGGRMYFERSDAANLQEACVCGKAIALSIISHESAKKHYPMVYSVDAQGRPLLSWRVHMLPYLQESVLYRQFHLDEPWDSPHNLSLLPKMPAVFQSSGLTLPEGYTCWLAPVSKDSVIVRPEDANPYGRDTPGIRNGDLNMGSALTILVIEVNAEAAVPWTAPFDYDYSPDPPLRHVGGNRRGEVISVWADGHVTSHDISLRPENWLIHFKRAWSSQDLDQFDPYDL